MASKILITGGNGLLGQKIVTFLARAGAEFLATSRNAEPHRPDIPYRAMDITDAGAVEAVFAEYRPEVVIHTAAMTNVDACETDQETAWKINVEGTAHVLRACRQDRAHLVHLSTDFIFDGENGPYQETAKPNPVNFYGKTKLESESLVEASGIPCAILRTILVYGYAPTLQRSNFVLWLRDTLRQNKTARVVGDQFRAPTLAEDLAQACLAAAGKRAQGVFHISGAQTRSIYEWAGITAEVFGLDKKLLQRITSEELNQPARRPPKTGFVLSKAWRELEWTPRPFKEGVSLLKSQIEEASA